jgi:hypothetical protein
MNPLAAAALAAGELICEFNTELVLVYEALRSRSAEVLSTRHAGRRTVQVREGAASLHLIEGLGASVRVTTLTDCLRSRQRGGPRSSSATPSAGVRSPRTRGCGLATSSVPPAP